MYIKPLLALLGLVLVCWVIQLLPVISVPITSVLYLSYFRDYKYGVFGICDLKEQVCSEAKIGYPSLNSTFSDFTSNTDFGYDGGIILPSKVTYSISKLLVVHVLAFCFSSILIVVIILLLVINFLDQRRKSIRVSSLGDEQQQQQQHQGELKKRDLTPYFNLMLVMTLFSFLTTLLAFLADILLFIPHLSFIGWLQLIPIVSMALTTSMLCFLKRSISSRKFFDDDNNNLQHQYANDDMRMMRKNVIDHFGWNNNDNSSDDGFYVFTDGFYSTTDNQNKNLHGGRRRRSDQDSETQIPTSPFDNRGATDDDEYSIESNLGQYQDNIQLQNLRR